MTDKPSAIYPNIVREPWNKGKLIGAKPPLRPKHVWAIRTKLQLERDHRDLALFNLAIDSKLRGCDVVAIRVEDVAPRGYAVDRASVRQRKTGRSVKFELHAFDPPDEGDVDLQTHWQPPCGTAVACTHEDREHGAISRHRSRRCS